MFLGPSRVVVEPNEEPVSLGEAKTHLRVDHADDDALILGLIQAARRACEASARRVFVTQTLELSLAAWPPYRSFTLPAPPLQSVTSIVYTDADGNTHTMSAADYVVHTTAEPGMIVLKSAAAWPSTTLADGPAIAVRYVAGYGGATAVPAHYKAAILLWVGHLYENREGVVVGTIASVVPMAVESLLQFERVDWF